MTAGLVTPVAGGAAVLYTLGAVAHLTLFFRRGYEGLARWSTRAAWAAHTTALALLVAETGRAPVYSLYEVSLLLAWLLLTPYVTVEYVKHNQSAGSFLTPIIAAVLVMSLILPRPGEAPNLGAHPERLVLWHVGVTLLGYLFLLGASVAGALYLVQDRNLRRKAFSPLYHTLPSLEWLDQSAGRMVAIGFPLLTLGVTAGLTFASRTWSHLWPTDPKVLFTILLWLTYGSYLVMRKARQWGGRWAAWWTVGAGTAILVNYFVINMASGVHRF
ncbi:cytochrome C assembly family protein [Symbiobacterium terraclitae]|uniref:cytochrome C assembly family protein n=1 Tax=Symbiobacterium terraclitae TaxID=557451 RepID=UPI0035B56E74